VNANDVVDDVKKNDDDDAKVNYAKANENDDAKTIEIVVVAVDDDETRKTNLKTKEVKTTMTTRTMNEVANVMRSKERDAITNDDDVVDGDDDANSNSS
jgi:hypothetical protein